MSDSYSFVLTPLRSPQPNILVLLPGCPLADFLRWLPDQILQLSHWNPSELSGVLIGLTADWFHAFHLDDVVIRCQRLTPDLNLTDLVFETHYLPYGDLSLKIPWTGKLEALTSATRTVYPQMTLGDPILCFQPLHSPELDLFRTFRKLDGYQLSESRLLQKFLSIRFNPTTSILVFNPQSPESLNLSLDLQIPEPGIELIVSPELHPVLVLQHCRLERHSFGANSHRGRYRIQGHFLIVSESLALEVAGNLLPSDQDPDIVTLSLGLSEVPAPTLELITQRLLGCNSSIITLDTEAIFMVDLHLYASTIEPRNVTVRLAEDPTRPLKLVIGKEGAIETEVWTHQLLSTLPESLQGLLMENPSVWLGSLYFFGQLPRIQIFENTFLVNARIQIKRKRRTASLDARLTFEQDGAQYALADLSGDQKYNWVLEGNADEFQLTWLLIGIPKQHRKSIKEILGFNSLTDLVVRYELLNRKYVIKFECKIDLRPGFQGVYERDQETLVIKLRHPDGGLRETYQNEKVDVGSDGKNAEYRIQF